MIKLSVSDVFNEFLCIVYKAGSIRKKRIYVIFRVMGIALDCNEYGECAQKISTNCNKKGHICNCLTEWSMVLLICSKRFLCICSNGEKYILELE